MSVHEMKGNFLTSDCDVRAYSVSCQGGGSQGIGEELRKMYPAAWSSYEALCKTLGDKLLGEVHFEACHDGTIIAYMFTQGDDDIEKEQTDLLAWEECLDRLNIFAAKTKLIIGFVKEDDRSASDRKWDKIHEQIQKYFQTDITNCIIVEQSENSENGDTEEGKITKSITLKSDAKTPGDKGKGKETTEVSIFIGGTCAKNTGLGGWGVILSSDGVKSKELCGSKEATSADQMELTAAIRALEALKFPCKIQLYSASQYVVNAFVEGWLNRWKEDGWRNGDVKNLRLWQRLDKLVKLHTVTIRWIKDHTSNPQITRCHELANAAAAKE